MRNPSGGLHLHYPGTDPRNASVPGRHWTPRPVWRLCAAAVLDRAPTPARGPTCCTPTSRTRPAAALGRHHRPAHPTEPDPAPPPHPRRRDGVAPTGWLAEHLARQREGNRDNALFWAACRAAEAGVTDLHPLITAGVP